MIINRASVDQSEELDGLQSGVVFEYDNMFYMVIPWTEDSDGHVFNAVDLQEGNLELIPYSAKVRICKDAELRPDP